MIPMLGLVAMFAGACGSEKDGATDPVADGPDALSDGGGADGDSTGDDGSGSNDALSCDDPVSLPGDITIEVGVESDLCETANAVEGSLVIRGADFGDDALGGLSCLCSVGGALVFEDTSVTGLDPLSRLTVVGGLDLVGNDALASVQGLSNLSVIDGDMTVEGSPGLSNLVGLGLVETTGSLTLANLGLVNLRGLDGLVTVGGDLTLVDLPALADMTGAGALDFVDGNFTVESTGAHTFEGLEAIRRVRQAFVVRDSEASLEGLDSLATVGGTLFLDDVSRMSSLEGLSGLAEVGGHLRIDDAPTLNSLNGLSNLRNISGILWLTKTNVTSLTGLSRIIAVGGLHLDTNTELVSTAGLPPVVEFSELVLHWNSALVDLTHLDTVRTVTGPLTVSGHVALTRIEELYGISAVDGDVAIVNNVALSSDEANGLVDAIGRDNIGGEIDVSGNSG